MSGNVYVCTFLVAFNDIAELEAWLGLYLWSGRWVFLLTPCSIFLQI